MDSYDILVIILSTVLAVFLVLAIIFTIYLIRIAKRVNEISEKAMSAVDNVEMAARVLQKSAAPAAFAKVVATVVESWQDRKSKKGD